MDTSSDSVVSQNDGAKADTSEDSLKERPSKKSKKKEKEKEKEKGKEKEKEKKENPETSSRRSRAERKPLVLPIEASVVAIFLLVLLVAFYVVCMLNLLQVKEVFLDLFSVTIICSS